MTALREGWEADVVLSDGAVAVLRGVLPTDRELLVDFYSRVSDHSKYLRFFNTHPELTDEDLADWLRVDGRDRVTLVIVVHDEIVATARYVLVPEAGPGRVADVSFLVRDDHHGRGAAHILLEHLAQIGREADVDRFYAEMLTSNHAMKHVFIGAGYEVHPALEDGFITVDFAIDPTTRSRTVMLQREHRAESASIGRLLTPASVAVVGDARRMSGIVSAIVAGGYGGRVHVLTDASGTGGPELLERLDEPVDLVIAESAGKDVTALFRAAAARQAHGMVFLADGDYPNLSVEETAELVSRARAHGIRACGPASLGIINTDPGHRLNASPAPAVTPGRVGLFTQSAGVATLVLSRAIERGCGVSSFVASGAFADVTANDIMQYWSDDPATEICLLSLDAIGNPRKFFRILRRLALEKPVVIFTPGRALRSARHHSGTGLPPAPAEAFDEVIRHTGAITTSRRETMFDIAQILARQPVPAGRRVRVISNSAGLTDQMEQAARRFGLLPDPVTVSGDAVHGIVEATRAALEDRDVDVVVSAAVEISRPIRAQVHEALTGLCAGSTVPLISVSIGFGDPPDPGADAPGTLPVFTSYADALEAVALIVDNEHRREAARPRDVEVPAPETDVTDLLDAHLSEHPAGGWLDHAETTALLAAHGIPFVGPGPVAPDDLPVGASLSVRAVEDPVLGPMISVGMSGAVPLLLDDRTWRVPPLRPADARSMLEGLATAALLTGHGDTPGVDTREVEEILVNVARLKDEQVRVVEIDLGPVLVGPEGTCIAEARVRVAPLPAERDPLTRSL